MTRHPILRPLRRLGNLLTPFGWACWAFAMLWVCVLGFALGRLLGSTLALAAYFVR